MNCYYANFILDGEVELAANNRDYRDPESETYTQKTCMDVSVCIIAENLERAKVLAAEWTGYCSDERCWLDRVKSVSLDRIELCEEDCDEDYSDEGYDSANDEYQKCPYWY